MSKSGRIWLIAAAVLTVLGLILIAGAMLLSGGNLSGWNTETLVTNSHSVSGDFAEISIETDTADVLLLPSDDASCKVVCKEFADEIHTVSVLNGVLSVRLTQERKWYDSIGIGTENPAVTVYLPQSAYAGVSLKTATGDVEIRDGFVFGSVGVSTSTGDVKCCAAVSGVVEISAGTGDITLEENSVGSLNLSASTGRISVHSAACAGDIRIHVTTGDVSLRDVACASLITDGGTGDLNLNRVTAADRFSIERSTGDVEFAYCDAGEIFIKTTTGDVEGSFLSDKVFVIESNTGDIEVPKTMTGGLCEITTDTGDIEIDIHPAER